MIACISPSDAHVDENTSTLSYAARARTITNAPTVKRLDRTLRTMLRCAAMSCDALVAPRWLHSSPIVYYIILYYIKLAGSTLRVTALPRLHLPRRSTSIRRCTYTTPYYTILYYTTSYHTTHTTPYYNILYYATPTAQVNVDPKMAQVRGLQEEIAQLKAEIARLQQLLRLGGGGHEAAPPPLPQARHSPPLQRLPGLGGLLATGKLHYHLF